MAEKNDMQVAENESNSEKTKSTTEIVEKDVAAQGTGETETEAVDENDITDVIDILNAIDKDGGGKGEIGNIPPELAGVVKFIVGKMIALRDAFEDPLFKAVLDDLVDQKEDGQTPSVAVAIVRNVPIQELVDLADSEEYEGAQTSLKGKLDAGKKEQEDDAKIEAGLNESKANLDAYAAKNNLNEARKTELWNKVLAWATAFANGVITEAEYAKVDKGENYDNDIASIKNQLPEQPKKEVLPDKASVEAAINPAPKAPAQPRNQLEMLGMMQPTTDVTEIGKRKRSPMGR